MSSTLLQNLLVTDVLHSIERVSLEDSTKPVLTYMVYIC